MLSFSPWVGHLSDCNLFHFKYHCGGGEGGCPEKGACVRSMGEAHGGEAALNSLDLWGLRWPTSWESTSGPHVASSANWVLRRDWMDWGGRDGALREAAVETYLRTYLAFSQGQLGAAWAYHPQPISAPTAGALSWLFCVWSAPPPPPPLGDLLIAVTKAVSFYTYSLRDSFRRLKIPDSLPSS